LLDGCGQEDRGVWGAARRMKAAHDAAWWCAGTDRRVFFPYNAFVGTKATRASERTRQPTEQVDGLVAKRVLACGPTLPPRTAPVS